MSFWNKESYKSQHFQWFNYLNKRLHTDLPQIYLSYTIKQQKKIFSWCITNGHSAITGLQLPSLDMSKGKYYETV
jgi:hypothetical protein